MPAVPPYSSIDHRHVELVLLHLPEKLRHPLLLGNEHRRPDELPERALGAAVLSRVRRMMSFR